LKLFYLLSSHLGNTFFFRDTTAGKVSLHADHPFTIYGT